MKAATLFSFLISEMGATVGVTMWYQFSSLQPLSHVWLFVIPWTAACQTSLSITNSWSILKLMSIGSVMPSNHLILCCPFSSCPQSFKASGSFPVSQFFALGSQSIEASGSASVLPINIQDWFPLEWTGWISLLLDLLADIFQRTLLKEQPLRYRRFQWKTTAQRQECPSLCVLKLQHSTLLPSARGTLSEGKEHGRKVGI